MLFEKLTVANSHLNKTLKDFPGGSVVKNPPPNAGGMGKKSLIWDDPTRQAATTPVHRNYCACGSRAWDPNY